MGRERRWMARLARAGYSARGVVYAIIGVFAVLAAFGSTAKKGTEGALVTLLQQPFGQALVWLVVVGLVGYVLWRAIQSVFDTDGHGLKPKGLAVRLGLLASAGAYATLALYALALLGVFDGGTGGGGTGGGGTGGGGGSVAQTLAGFVGSQWAALVLALVFAGVALAHAIKAVRRKYAEHFQARAPMGLVHPLATAGLLARGVVFAIVALLLAYRFFDVRGAAADTASRPGLEEALGFVQGLPFGAWLLALMGAGLIAFAAYSLAEARWREVNVEDA